MRPDGIPDYDPCLAAKRVTGEEGYLVGSCHTFPGRMALYIPAEGITLCTSKDELAWVSPEADYWIQGFLHGAVPRLEDDADEEDWSRAREDFLETGEWSRDLPPFADPIAADDDRRWMAISVVVGPRTVAPGDVDKAVVAGMQARPSGRLVYRVPTTNDHGAMMEGLISWLAAHESFIAALDKEWIDVRLGCSAGKEGQLPFAISDAAVALMARLGVSLMIDVYGG